MHQCCWRFRHLYVCLAVHQARGRSARTLCRPFSSWYLLSTAGRSGQPGSWSIWRRSHTTKQSQTSFLDACDDPAIYNCDSSSINSRLDDIAPSDDRYLKTWHCSSSRSDLQTDRTSCGRSVCRWTRSCSCKFDSDSRRGR